MRQGAAPPMPTSRRSQVPFEGAGHLAGDPATVEVARLGEDRLTGHGASIHQARIDGGHGRLPGDGHETAR
jgi:hypothetical protein